MVREEVQALVSVVAHRPGLILVRVEADCPIASIPVCREQQLPIGQHPHVKKRLVFSRARLKRQSDSSKILSTAYRSLRKRNKTMVLGYNALASKGNNYA